MIRRERCLGGRLSHAYPVARNDIEIQVGDVARPNLTDVLRAESDQVFTDDPHCRKIVFAAPVDNAAVVGAAQHAGFRYVLEVDVPWDGGVEHLALMVREPSFVTVVDVDRERVPDSAGISASSNLLGSPYRSTERKAGVARTLNAG
ncbi:hypothetical protein [Nocardioides sp. LS1]|uniref:hypothetical protein n=1 Tax=Nocardioides sp. LS1 TaxID=1027620 RepID=UPI000F6181DE|nr:hypothetical protein [Nocardioides sp. LS1]GCD88639.1 hypothetical protein NLS1_06450 [Nocardioides sp. LS1]